MTAPPQAAPESLEPREYSHSEILQVMTGLLAALFTALISTTIVSTALPTIMADLHGTQRQYTWVITASLLAMTVVTPIWGKLSDLFNKKTLTQLSIVLFVAGSILAGVSNTIAVLMVARVLQGVAMGGLTALVQAIMGQIIAPRARGRYAGYMGAVMAVATVSGPLLGGVITDHLGWRWCFFVTAPLAVVALILLQLKLQLPTLYRKRARIDYLGSVLVSVGAAIPMLWVTFAGSDYDWISWESGAFLAGFLVVAIAAILVELRAEDPIIPIHLLRNSTAALMIIASISAGVGMFGSGVFLTQYFQLGTGATPTVAGLMTIPMILTQMLSATIGGQIVSRIGKWKPVMLVGSIVMLVGMLGLGTISHTTPYYLVAIYMALMGMGIGAMVQNVVLAVQNTVDVTDVGAASAAISFFRSLGGAIGVSILGAVLTNKVGSNIAAKLADLGVPASAMSGSGSDTQLDISGLPAPLQEVFHQAYADAFGPLFFIAAMVAAVSVIAVIIVRGTPLRTTVGMKPAPSGQAEADKAGADKAGADKAGAADSAYSPEASMTGDTGLTEADDKEETSISHS